MTKKITSVAIAIMILISTLLCYNFTSVKVSASSAHSSSRDVQSSGVGNPFNYGERNTPSTASVSQMREINHNMTVQEIKYAIYKEVDEHWDLLKVRLGVTEREKVYALFLGLATRESTLGNDPQKHGADLETNAGSSFGTNAAQAYGPFQTAVTAYKNNNSNFMTEYDVPEMTQYDLTEQNFYDCVISLHMGIRKILHFVTLAINDEHMTGYQVIRNALKGFNTGWATAGSESEYTDYADEIIALAHWYYSNGHLYDNETTWHTDSRASEYRSNPWSWWVNASPSLASVSPSSSVVEEATVNSNADITKIKLGDANMDGSVDSKDSVIILQDYARSLIGKQKILTLSVSDANKDNAVNSKDAVVVLQYYAQILLDPNYGDMEKFIGYSA